MKESLLNVIKSLYKDVPDMLYLALLLLFIVICIFIIQTKINKVRSISKVLFAELVVLLYCSTVVFRPVKDNLGYSMSLFESYGYNNEDQYFLLADNLLNIAIYVPFGLLLGIGFRKIKWFQVLFSTLLVSVSIEFLQFFFHKGYAEVDDVFHNVLGCMIGFGFYSMIEKVYKRRVAVLLVFVLVQMVV